MKQQTIINTILRWSKFIGIEPPKIVIKLHVKRKVKRLIPNEDKHDYIMGTVRVFGCFNTQNNKITIYRDGNKLNVVKHEFIHYLRKLKSAYDMIDMDWRAIPNNYDDYLKQLGDDEETATRKLTCMGWQNIYKWYHEEN